jgi:hypothetical protein
MSLASRSVFIAQVRLPSGLLRYGELNPQICRLAPCLGLDLASRKAVEDYGEKGLLKGIDFARFSTAFLELSAFMCVEAENRREWSELN